MHPMFEELLSNSYGDSVPCWVCGAEALFFEDNRSWFEVGHNCDCYRTPAYDEGYHAVAAKRYARAEYFKALPSGYRAYLNKEYDPSASIAAFKAMASWRERPLAYFWGEPGVGKTHLAVIAGLILIDRGLRVRFLREIDFLGAARGAAAGRQPDLGLRGYDVVIMDDFGKEKATDFYYTTIYRLLEERTSEGGGLIITSNHSPEAGAERVTFDPVNAQAVLSRLRAGETYQLTGADRRVRR